MSTKVFDDIIRGTVPLIKGSGVRCRTCAIPYSHDDIYPPAYCSKHSKGKKNEIAQLGRLVVPMQEWCYKLAVARHKRDGKSVPEEMELKTKNEHCLWERINVFSSQSGMFGVLDGREVKFVTNGKFRVVHCAFDILLNSGARYVVDPTGIQFGPHWPLVCPYDEYEARFMHDDKKIRNLQSRELGTNARLLDEGKIHLF
ncbi:hypothetical protein ACEQ8H_005796 [Pleosporales sp. CAS-2024a]